ncbi:MAG: class I SAM-dependent methyltransferase [Candidatus Hodarchaeota archaeon]
MEEHFKNKNKKKTIIEKYNSSSHFYDKRYKALQKEKYEIILKNYIANGKTILDLGCGTGLFFEYIVLSLKKQHEIRINYIALDISRNMLLRFKSKVIFHNIKSINLILSDIEHLPFRDNIFHSIFSITSFQNLPHIQIGIRESFRVSKNNAEYKFSILRKKIELQLLLKIFKPKIKEIEIISKENLEDIIIQGKISKDQAI